MRPCEGEGEDVGEEGGERGMEKGMERVARWREREDLQPTFRVCESKIEPNQAD